MIKKFKKMVVLDRIVLTELQWTQLRGLAEEVVEFSGLRPEDVSARLKVEQAANVGAVCFTALAQERTTVDMLNERLEGADAVITCWTNLPDGVLKANSQIRYIGFWTNLPFHRVSMKLAEEMGIVVTHIPDYGTESVAEWTMTVLLSMARQPARHVQESGSGKWVYELIKRALYIPSPKDIEFFTLQGKKLGIIGFGRIGQRVAELVTAFGMQVRYYSLHRRPEWEKKGVEFMELDELLGWADVVSNHLSPYANSDLQGRVQLDDFAPDCPEQDQVHKDTPVITAERLAMIRDGAIFINTAAGRLVDEEALKREAQSGRIRVAIDVWRSNPDRRWLGVMKNLFKRDKHILTYRAAWFTRDAVTFKGDELVRQAIEFLSR